MKHILSLLVTVLLIPGLAWPAQGQAPQGWPQYRKENTLAGKVEPTTVTLKDPANFMNIPVGGAPATSFAADLLGTGNPRPSPDRCSSAAQKIDNISGLASIIAAPWNRVPPCNAPFRWPNCHRDDIFRHFCKAIKTAFRAGLSVAGTLRVPWISAHGVCLLPS